jgi:hypothetical protein
VPHDEATAQWPVKHPSFAAQACPQDPQLAGSSLHTSMQVSPQHVNEPNAAEQTDPSAPHVVG